MSDPNVERWRERGTVFMWKNKHPRMREWNMMADASACEAILDLLDRMENAQWPCKTTLCAVKPTIPPDHGGHYEFWGATTFTLNYRKGVVPDDHWVLEERNQGVVLTVGLGRLRELRDAIVDMNHGGGDYSIGGESGRLWIWWYIKQPTNMAYWQAASPSSLST